MDNHGDALQKELDEFIKLQLVRGQSQNTGQALTSQVQVQVSWTTNETKILLDLYKKYKPKIGTQQIRSLKKVWEIMAQEINKLFHKNLTPSHCENRWRVLERAYKKYIDNQSKTGQGKKYFEYLEEMDEIFKGKRNVKPVLLLSNNTIEEMSDPESDQEHPKLASTYDSTQNETPTIKKSEKSKIEGGSLKRKRTPALNRNVTLVGMKKDRKEYQEAKLQVEKEKLAVQKKKLEAMQERNLLLKERNQLLLNQQNSSFF